MADLASLLHDRADACELCGATDGLAAHTVGPDATDDLDHAVLACATCRAQLDGEADLDPKHWFGLQEAVWSEHAPVQVTAWRLLRRLTGESWARDLLDQVWLDDETRAWAEAGLQEEIAPPVLDAHGTPLADGDTVTLIKDLDVKGAGFTAKRGTTVKGIRLGDVEGHVEGRVNGTSIYLKTEFLKKLG